MSDPANPQPPQQGWQYDNFFKGFMNEGVIRKAEREDPFEGETPTTPKEYRSYQANREKAMMEALDWHLPLKITINCEVMDLKGKRLVLPGPKKTHIGSSFVFGCQHIIIQDPDGPDKIYFWPLERGSTKGYYVCKSCFDRIEKHRYNFDTEIEPHCALCISEVLTDIENKHPGRLITLRRE